MQAMQSSPAAMIRCAFENRKLIARMCSREIQSRHRGTVLGAWWSIGAPLVMLGAYLFVFMSVLEARWDEGSGGKAEYALIVFAGLIAFNFFAECVNRSPGLVLENPSYVKRSPFPLEVLPLVCVGSAAFNALAGAAILIACQTAFLGPPPVTALLLPAVLSPLLLLALGLTWFFAALGVYLRDLKQFLTVATALLMFFSPVFYPVSAVKGSARLLLWCNPLTLGLEAIRSVLFWGVLPDWRPFAVFCLLSALSAWLGFAFFVKTKSGFADVV